MRLKWLGFALTASVATGCIPTRGPDNDTLGRFVDLDGDGMADGVIVDTDHDNIADGIDTTGDGKPDRPLVGGDGDDGEGAPNRGGDSGNPSPGDGDSDDGTGGGDDTPVGDGDGTRAVAGSKAAANCDATKKSSGELCASLYCGVSKTDILAELASGAKCSSDKEVSLACEATTSAAVGKCARDSAFSLDPVSATRDCARKNTQLTGVSDACLECYVVSAKCGKDNCTSQCLSGDSPSCDKCRIANGCTTAFYTCSGLPSPL